MRSLLRTTDARRTSFCAPGCAIVCAHCLPEQDTEEAIEVTPWFGSACVDEFALHPVAVGARACGSVVPVAGSDVGSRSRPGRWRWQNTIGTGDYVGRRGRRRGRAAADDGRTIPPASSRASGFKKHFRGSIATSPAPASCARCRSHGSNACWPKRIADGQGADDVMRNLAGLTRVQYVFCYPETGDIVIAGPAEAWGEAPSGRMLGIESGRPVVELQDLIVALRTFPPGSGKSVAVHLLLDRSDRRRPLADAPVPARDRPPVHWPAADQGSSNSSSNSCATSSACK